MFNKAMADWTWIVAHLIFGGAVGMIYFIWRSGRTEIEPRLVRLLTAT